MEEEKIIAQAAQAGSEATEPVTETAADSSKRWKRRTKAEIEADAKKAAEKAKRDAKKAAATAKKVAGGALDTVANAAKQAVEEGAQAAEKIARPRIPTPEIVVQYSGAEIGAAALTEAAVAQFRAERKRVGIKDIKLYIKPEEQAAYFVINGDFSGKVDF